MSHQNYWTRIEALILLTSHCSVILKHSCLICSLWGDSEHMCTWIHASSWTLTELLKGKDKREFSCRVQYRVREERKPESLTKTNTNSLGVLKNKSFWTLATVANIYFQLKDRYQGIQVYWNHFNHRNLFLEPFQQLYQCFWTQQGLYFCAGPPTLALGTFWRDLSGWCLQHWTSLEVLWLLQPVYTRIHLHSKQELVDSSL